MCRPLSVKPLPLPLQAASGGSSWPACSPCSAGSTPSSATAAPLRLQPAGTEEQGGGLGAAERLWQACACLWCSIALLTRASADSAAPGRPAPAASPPSCCSRALGACEGLDKLCEFLGKPMPHGQAGALRPAARRRRPARCGGRAVDLNRPCRSATASACLAARIQCRESRLLWAWFSGLLRLKLLACQSSRRAPMTWSGADLWWHPKSPILSPSSGQQSCAFNCCTVVMG